MPKESSTSELELLPPSAQKRGGKARAESLSPEIRSAIASKAAQARWSKSEDQDTEILDEAVASSLPEARYKGYLSLLGTELPCYVLSDGQRVIGRTSMTEMLTGIKGGGALETYLTASSLKNYIDIEDLKTRLVEFKMSDVEALNRKVKGLPADLVIDICSNLVSALDSHMSTEEPKLTPRQITLATKASMFLASCAKVGLDALVDEATGYQYERANDALQIKLKMYLEEEMRKWEKTFPDELWMEFGRLTGWKGNLHSRPKYWGKLVIELIYEYLDEDVAKWLKENAPKPRHGQNYHQWLSNQYGLKKLVEHIWMVIGMAKTCNSMSELRDSVASINGKRPIQLKLYIPRD